MGKNILLIIDPQNDFCNIDETNNRRKYLTDDDKEKSNPFGQSFDSAGLPVAGGKDIINNEPINGAVVDLNNLTDFLQKNGSKIDEIHVSLDSHTKTHIGHIGFWNKEPGEGYIVPRPLQEFLVYDDEKNFDIYIGENKAVTNSKTPISIGKVKTENPELQKWAYYYIREMQNKYIENPTKPLPCLWAEHCIKGEEGWKVYKPLLNELNKLGTKVKYHEKGTNDLVEMYSIFSAEESYEDLLDKIGKFDEKYKNTIKEMYPMYPKDETVTPIKPMITNEPNLDNNYNTKFNSDLFKQLIGDDRTNKIFVCGEAKSHCVKTSLEDMLKHCNDFGFPKDNIYVIADMTSIINAYAIPTKIAYENMTKGLQIIDTNQFKTILINRINDGGDETYQEPTMVGRVKSFFSNGGKKNKTTKKSKVTKSSKKSSKKSSTKKHRKTYKSKH